MANAKRWTKREEAYVRNNYKKLTTKAMAEKLGRPYGGVTWKIQQLGLPKELNNPKVTVSVSKPRGTTYKVPVRTTTSRVPVVVPKKPWWKFWA